LMGNTKYVSHTKGRKNQYMTELNSIRGREYTYSTTK
jgi:hypothetical protein